MDIFRVKESRLLADPAVAPRKIEDSWAHERRSYYKMVVVGRLKPIQDVGELA